MRVLACARRREERRRNPRKEASEEEGEMGKYLRKCRGSRGEVAAMEVTQVLGVRTRSRATAAAAAAVAKRRKASPPPPPPPEEEFGARNGDGGGCYLQLRSRTLFMAAAPPRQLEAENSAPPPPAAAVSSAASSVEAAPREESRECRGEASPSVAAEAGEDHEDLGSSVSDSGSCRERRETTPSSHPGGELSDLESEAGRKHHRRLLATSAATIPAGRTPPAVEIEEFFAAAEKAQAERFALKYNFDIVRGVPLDAGRFEWAPPVSI